MIRYTTATISILSVTRTTSVYYTVYTSAYTGAPCLEHNSEEGLAECARQEAGERAKSAENKQEWTKDRLREMSGSGSRSKWILRFLMSPL